MATPMGPPVLPGYSLRVQLFSPLAHALGDKPIRCFRVVTNPEATIREFCQEASRIHEINYGEPLAIKKVQDDQEFDITQNEILGHLFTNTATIRVIQAAANPSIRDSVPPTSALRFDPNVTRKREREGSVRPNGTSPSSAWKPNKRQRVSELDPDEPLPSRENEPERRNGRAPEVKVIPDSQDEGPSPRQFNPSRQSEKQSQNGVSNHSTEMQNSSPLVQASERAQSNGSQRAKSSSYHISRPADRGTSVSTAATSPSSVDQQTPTQNGLISANKRKRTDPPPKPRPNANRSTNEDTIYDSIVSEDEGAAILRKKKSSLKMRNSPSNGLPGIDSIWSNNTFNTPPNGTRRPVRSREGSSAGELPLTPNSKEREKRQQEKGEADEAKKARRAAAEAAEQRRLEADEARQAEEARIAKEERAKREQQERLEVEESQREAAKRQSVIEKAARLQKECEEKREAEERVVKEKAESERLAKKKAEAEAKKLREEKETERQTQAEEAKKLGMVEERKMQEKRAAEEALKKNSASPEEQRQRHHSSPILPRAAPSSAAKTQSSTPYIPSGRKSALKFSLSSQAVSSSPSSPEVSRGVGIEAQMPLPSKMNRKVSFDLHERKETAIKPPTRILPPTKSATPKVSVSKVSTPASKDLTRKLSQQGSVAPVKHLNTPIPVPSALRRSSLERSITPIGRAAVIPPPKVQSPQITRTKITPPTRSASQKSETPVIPPEKLIVIEDSASSDSDSEEDIPAVVSPAKLAKSTSLSSKPTLPTLVAAKTEQSEEEEEEEIDEDETQSHNPSTRDSRSPVIYSQHTKTEPVPALRPALESHIGKDGGDNESSKSSSEDSEEEFNEPTPKPKSREVPIKDAEGEESEDSEAEAEAAKAEAQDVEMEDDEEEETSEESASESEGEGTEVQVPKSSPPILPAAKPAKVSAPKPTQTNNSRSAINSSAVPSSSAIRPAFKVGASLSGLNSAKQPLGSKTTKPSTTTKSSQQPKVNMDNGSESEEEEEEESDEQSTYSSDEEPRKPIATKFAMKSQPKAKYSDSSDEDSSENEDEKSKAQKELTAMIEGLANGDSQVSLPSPKAYRSSTQQEVKKYGKKGEKKVDKYTTGYKFSMPK